MKKTTVLAYSFNGFAVLAQTKEEQTIKEIYKSSLTNSKCYAWLDDLSNKIGSRLSGSAGAESGSIYKSTIRDPWLRSCISGSDGAQMGERRKETAYIQDNKTKITVPICALGGSVATAKTVTAEVIEVHSIKELAELGVDKIKGKSFSLTVRWTMKK
jgi:hypothetical protein